MTYPGQQSIQYADPVRTIIGTIAGMREYDRIGTANKNQSSQSINRMNERSDK